MKKSDIEYMQQFKAGQKIRIIDANYHKDTIGKEAEILKVIKTKMELQVLVSDGYIPYGEMFRMKMEKNYVPFKHYVYYPSAKNVVSIEKGSTIVFRGYLGKYIEATMNDDNTLYDIVKILNNRVVVNQLREGYIHYIYIE